MAFLAAGLGTLAGGSCTSRALADGPDPGNRLILNDYSPWDWTRFAELACCSVSVKDSAGGWVTGLTLDDFELSEALISPAGEVIDERTITFDEPDYQFDGDGFWERSVSADKPGTVFVIDASGTMEEQMPGICWELHERIDQFPYSWVGGGAVGSLHELRRLDAGH